MELMVSALRINGDDNLDIELIDPTGADLPEFEPGAHIDIRTPGGALRQYSLCGHTGDRRRYVICVRRDAASRGGSRSLHDGLRVRARVEIGGPRNLFPLPAAGRYILFSAGIGITPILTMARTLAAQGAAFELHHYERSAERVAYLDELRGLGPVTLHLASDGVRFRDAAPACLSQADPDAAVLACGPNGFLDLLEQRLLDAGWDAGQFHAERFRPEAPKPVEGDGFEVRIASTGQSFSIGAGDTIANVLLANGVPVELSCEAGMCGACLTRVLDGTPDHRDIVLSPAEQAAGDQLTICCSRAKSPVLVLDL